MNTSVKILLVDDEPHVRKYISLLIKGVFAGPVIMEAGNSDDALRLYRENQPDLVMLDINMPGRDGLEILNDLRDLDGNAYVIMLTSVSARASVQKAVDLGASGYILKDTPAQEIKQHLAEIAADFTDEETES